MKLKIGNIRLLLAIVLCLVGILAAFFISRFFSIEDSSGQDKTMKVNVYFVNNLTKSLEAETREIRAGDKQQMVEDIISALMAGPKSAALAKSVPSDSDLITHILWPSENDDKNITTVTFSEKYLALSAAEAVYCRSALVWTLTELPFIDGIAFYVGQDELLKSNGQSVGLLNRENVVISPEIPIEKTNLQKVVLYFSDVQALGLKAEERYIEVNPDQSMEKYIILELLKGPESGDLINLVPTETKLISANTEESICIIDLSKEFVDKHAGGSTAVRLSIFSIVNSLCELSNVKKVQFLIEGQKIQDFKGMMDLAKPLEPDVSMLISENED